jgi:DNA polymerase-3 subunit gamma/tau
MSHLVLSRKYRPKSFKEVIGQDNALTILNSFIQSGMIPHALLFCGSRGVGKTSLARIFAKTINCEDLKNSKKCKDCITCSEIDENKSLDVIEIDAASNNGVDQIRSIIDSSNYTSIKCQYKVFIIDEVHMLSKSAFNALLKTLEEPNENTIFILATTEVEKIPATILSRCQTINFKSLKKETLSNHIGAICKKEGITIDKESRSLIADESTGSARDSLGILEQLSASLNKKIDIENSNIILGVTSKQILFEISKNLLSGNTKASLGSYNNIYDNGYDSKKFIHSLLNYFRSSIYYRLGLEDSVDEIYNLEQKEIDVFNLYDLSLLENLFDQLIKLYDLCSKTENIKFLVESNLIKLCIISNYIDLEEVIKDDEQTGGSGESIRPAKEESLESKIPQKPSSSKKKVKINIESFNSDEFLKELGSIDNQNLKLLKDCSFEQVNEVISIKTQNEIFYEILSQDEKKNEIKNLIVDIFRFDCSIEIEFVQEEGSKNIEDNFKFSEKKDKLYESETMKNLFNTFDCRVLDIEKDN